MILHTTDGFLFLLAARGLPPNWVATPRIIKVTL
jgi:hypothetical protein